MKISLPPKLVEKLVWVPVISFGKISFPVKHLMAYYVDTGRSRSLIAWHYPTLPNVLFKYFLIMFFIIHSAYIQCTCKIFFCKKKIKHPQRD
jgi:hypothetical protein